MEKRQIYEAPLSEEMLLYVENSFCGSGDSTSESLDTEEGDWG